MRKPSNKAYAMLAVLRETGPATCNALADEMRDRTPCATCNGTGEHAIARDTYRCKRCYGRGMVPFSYSDAYVVLQQLMAYGLVERRMTVNEWGDEGRPHVYTVVASDDTSDPLEALYSMPAVEVPHD